MQQDISCVLNLFMLFQVEEVPGDLTQSDLATDDVMLLDTGDQVTLHTWIHAELRWQTGPNRRRRKNAGFSLLSIKF